MEKKLEKLMDMLISTLEKGGDLIGEHVPAFFEEILAYETMYSLFGVGLFGFLFILCFVLWVVYFIQSIPGFKEDRMDIKQGMLVVYSIGLLMLGMGLHANVKDLIKIKVAPRVFTIEYLRDFKAGR